LFFFFFTADFGLAKQKNPDASKMTSMVGTILYSWYVQTSLCVFTWRKILKLRLGLELKESLENVSREN